MGNPNFLQFGHKHGVLSFELDPSQCTQVEVKSWVSLQRLLKNRLVITVGRRDHDDRQEGDRQPGSHCGRLRG